MLWYLFRTAQVTMELENKNILILKYWRSTVRNKMSIKLFFSLNESWKEPLVSCFDFLLSNLLTTDPLLLECPSNLLKNGHIVGFLLGLHEIVQKRHFSQCLAFPAIIRNTLIQRSLVNLATSQLNSIQNKVKRRHH